MIFCYRLSLYLKIPISKLLNEFSYDDLIGYIAFNQMEGFLDKFDYQMALIPTVINNLLSDKPKDIDDFVIKPDDIDNNKDTNEELLSKAIIINSLYGGINLKEGR